mgnify:CR=1 FL=1
MAALLQNCNVGGWAPFATLDPEEDEEQIVKLLMDRISEFLRFELKAGRDWATDFHPSGFETSEAQVTRILRRMKHNVDAALTEWKAWVKWRVEVEANEFKEGDFVEHVLPHHVAEWRGEDKEGRPCLLLTGRNLTEKARGLPYRYNRQAILLKEYIIYVVEKGIRDMDEKGIERCSIVYDRRGLGFGHIDGGLWRVVRDAILSCNRFYSDRIGPMYIMNMNWVFWGFFQLVIKPMLLLGSDGGVSLKAVQEVPDLLEFFESKNLLLHYYDPEGGEGEEEGNARETEMKGSAGGATMSQVQAGVLPPAQTRENARAQAYQNWAGPGVGSGSGSSASGSASGARVPAPVPKVPTRKSTGVGAKEALGDLMQAPLSLFQLDKMSPKEEDEGIVLPPTPVKR